MMCWALGRTRRYVVTTTVRQKFDTLAPMMNEQLRRRWAGCEAMAIGRGGISAVARSTGLSRNTIRRGIEEVRETMPGLAERAGEVAGIAEGLQPITNPNMKSDLTTALALARAAIEGALANVEINLESLQDKEPGFVAETLGFSR